MGMLRRVVEMRTDALRSRGFPRVILGFLAASVVFSLLKEWHPQGDVLVDATISGWIVLLWMPNRWKRCLISRLTETRLREWTMMCTEATILDSESDHTCRSVREGVRVSLGRERVDWK